jgi:hypothetical protein
MDCTIVVDARRSRWKWKAHGRMLDVGSLIAEIVLTERRKSPRPSSSVHQPRRRPAGRPARTYRSGCRPSPTKYRLLGWGIILNSEDEHHIEYSIIILSLSTLFYI